MRRQIILHALYLQQRPPTISGSDLASRTAVGNFSWRRSPMQSVLALTRVRHPVTSSLPFLPPALYRQLPFHISSLPQSSPKIPEGGKHLIASQNLCLRRCSWVLPLSSPRVITNKPASIRITKYSTYAPYAYVLEVQLSGGVSIKQQLSTQVVWSTKQNASTRRGSPFGTWKAWNRSGQTAFQIPFGASHESRYPKKISTYLRSTKLLLGVSQVFINVRLAALPRLFLIGRSNLPAPFFFFFSLAQKHPSFLVWPPLLDL